jgi:hypothetical protein
MPSNIFRCVGATVVSLGVIFMLLFVPFSVCLPPVPSPYIARHQNELLHAAEHYLIQREIRGITPFDRIVLESFSVVLASGVFHSTYTSTKFPGLVRKTFTPSSWYTNDHRTEVLYAIAVGMTETAYGRLGPKVEVYYDEASDEYTAITKQLVKADPYVHDVEKKFKCAVEAAASKYGLFAFDLHAGNVFYDAEDDALKVIDSDCVKVFNPYNGFMTYLEAGALLKIGYHHQRSKAA